MEWTAYLAIFRRRWLLILFVVALDVIAVGYLYAKTARHPGYQACLTLYVADVSSPSLIAATDTSLQNSGALLAGETAANFFGDDILDVAQSSKVSDFMARYAASHAPAQASASFGGSVSGARKDRTVNLCVANSNEAAALAGAQALGVAMTSRRATFIGRNMARRTFVQVVSVPTAALVSTSHEKVSALLRLILGVLVALGLAILWDVIDPSVRDERDAARAANVPVLATL